MDLTNLPVISDTIIKKSEGLLSKLFGPAVEAIGENLRARVKYRAFKNEVERLAEADELLKKKGFTAKPIAFKNLVTAIDLSGLEEDTTIQPKWSNLIANLAAYNSLEVFNQNCIRILGILSAAEIKILDHLYAEFVFQKGEVIEEREGRLMMKDFKNDVFNEDLNFDPWEIGKKHNIDDFVMKLYVDNLISLGLLQFEETELENDELVKSFNVHLTYLGIYFVRICKFQ